MLRIKVSCTLSIMKNRERPKIRLKYHYKKCTCNSVQNRETPRLTEIFFKISFSRIASTLPTTVNAYIKRHEQSGHTH